jgi:AmmeMemoRadiSam system protein A
MLLEAPDQARLLDHARTAIIDSLHAEPKLSVPTAVARHAVMKDASALLAEHGASFISLSIDDVLRGCIGSIEPSRVLADDVWRNAQRAAFKDPRFAPLREQESHGAHLEISILGPLHDVRVASEAQLLTTLCPNVDGLLLTFGTKRATFLPKVWQQLADPQVFVRQLKRKMGVAEDFWHHAVVIRRYETEEFSARLRSDQ